MNKIAIIGASDSVEKVYEILKKYSDIEFLLVKENKIELTTKFILKEENNVDGFFLTGVAIYHELLKSNRTSFKKPVAYSKRGSMSILKSLWEVSKNNNLEELKIGFDIIDETKFLDVCKEFDIKIKGYYHQEYIFGKNESDYLKEYIELYKKNKINCIFTSFGYIYLKLKELNIPVYRIQATTMEIENEFKNLLYRIKLKKAEKNKIATVIIKINNDFIRINEEFFTERKEIEKTLIEYSKEVQGSLQSISRGEYIVISNKNFILDNNNLIKLKLFIQKYKNIEVNIGIGEGTTVFNAEKNARQALKLSEIEKENSIFFYSEKEIKGPIFTEKELKYELDDRLNSISFATNININILNKLSLLQKKEKERYFDSTELAKYLDITERSVNRILKILFEKEYIDERKEKQLTGAGRPKRKVNFKF